MKRLVATVLVCSLMLTACGSKENTKSSSQNTLIDKFVAGTVSVDGVGDINSAVYWEKCDIDNDSVEELYLRTEQSSFILNENNNALDVIFEGKSSDFPVCNKDQNIVGCMSIEKESAPEHVMYSLLTFHEDGTKASTLSLVWYDMNENNEADEEDYYTINEKETSKEEFDTAAEIFTTYLD